MFRFLLHFLLVGGSCIGIASAQAPAPVLTSVPSLENLPRPPIPADPLELVTGAALNVQTPEQRLAAKTA